MNIQTWIIIPINKFRVILKQVELILMNIKIMILYERRQYFNCTGVISMYTNTISLSHIIEIYFIFRKYMAHNLCIV